MIVHQTLRRFVDERAAARMRALCCRWRN